MKRIIFSMAAVALMMVACSSEDTALDNAPVAGQKVHFTATIAAPNSGASTRTTYTEVTESTDPDFGKIKVAWKQGDEIALIHNGTKDVVAVQTLNADGSATISGDITAGTDGEDVTIVYPAASVDAPASGAEPIDNATYNAKLYSQEGTLAYIQDNLDFCRASGTLKVSGTAATLSDNISLASSIAVVKFSLTDGTDAINASEFVIKDGSDQVITTVSPAAATSTLYVAMQPATASDFKFEATDATTTYFYDKSGATLAAGKYYQSPLALKDMLHTPLTLEAIEDGTIHVTVGDGWELAQPIIYTKNGEEIPGGTTDFNITVAAGDIVSFHSANAVLAKLVNYSYKHANIKPTNRCYIYGNMMSMIDDEMTNDKGNYANDKVIASDLALYGLFSGAKKLESHPAKELLLPATTLTKYCYSELFSGCSALTKAPDLPATELKTRCYEHMFWECTSLTEAPVMSATTVDSYCCHNMFYNCTSMVKAPDLLSTTLAEYCYNGMFYGCSSLCYAECLATDVSAESCLGGWLEGVSAIGTLVVASGATWAVAGTNGIPSDWTVITE